MPYTDIPIRARRRPVRRVVMTAAAVVLGLAVTACGGAAAPSGTPVTTNPPTTAPTATPVASATAASPSAAPSQPSTGRIVVAGQGFAITLPDGWESIPVDPAQFQAFIDSLPADSDLRDVLESQAGAVQQAIKFWAFDVRPEHTAAGFARNVNIIVQPASSISLSVVESAAKAALEAIESIHKPVTSAMVELPSGQALRLDYVLDVPGPNATTIGVAGTQYYIQLPNATLIVSFSTDTGSVADATKDFDAIVNSIESVS